MQREKCKLCGDLLVDPVGPEDSPILMVGEFPGFYEVRSGVPFSGPSGEVLKIELAEQSLDWRRIRMTNLWRHGKKDKDEDELNYHLGMLLQEMEGRKAVFLMGSDCSKLLIGEGVLDISGLDVTGPLIPKSVEVMVAAVNPAFVLYDTVGEFREALKTFLRKARRFL